MNHVFLIVGAACYGWLLPEFIFMLAAHSERTPRQVPLAMNFMSVAGAIGLAVGLMP